MQYHRSLIPAVFVQRYKRFFVDARLENGDIVTAHCPNTGSMRNCIGDDWPVLLYKHDNPKRKLAYSLEFTQDPAGHWIGVNTHNANKVVGEALRAAQLPMFADYQQVRSEVKYGQQNSRIDFLLHQQGLPDCYIEVKSVTLLDQNVGYFPDAVTLRGQKHLQELREMAAQGHRAVLLFLVQHQGINQVRPAEHIDPTYSELLRQVAADGVEILAWGCHLQQQNYLIDQAIRVEL